VAYGSIPSESRWIDLARIGMTALDRPENNNAHGPPNRDAFDAALIHAKTLITAGKTAEAAAIFRALQELARDDSSALDAILRARDGK
jgi:hypothetical protein